MSQDSVDKVPKGYDDEIDLRELFSVLWQGKISIVIGGLLGAILSVGYALSLPNIYTSEAVIAPKPRAQDSADWQGSLVAWPA